MKPIIGITAGIGKDGDYYLRRRYCTAVHKAGGTPLLLAPVGSPLAAINVCDGILLSGGGDISPSLCGIAEYDPVYLDDPSPERDSYELELARLAFSSDTPTLGICRGLQIMNIALGGSLYFHIDGHFQKREKDQPTHTVSIAPSSALARLICSDTLEVNSFHHQAIHSAAPPLCITASSADGYAEAAEAQNRHFFLGVQWHPEQMEGHSSEVLFAALCSAASGAQITKG